MPRPINKSYPLVSDYMPNSPAAEAYRSLRTNLRFASVDKEMSVIMITSTGSGEGKTTTTSNLAITCALEGRRVLMIDADLRKPMLHHVFNCSSRIGLTDALTKRCSWQEAVQQTRVQQLQLLSAGPIPHNPVEMLASERMGRIIDECRSAYDLILIDTPPVLSLADAQVVGELCDGVLLVVQAGKTKRGMAKKAKHNLQRLGSKLLGVVMNNMPRSEANSYIYYG